MFSLYNDDCMNVLKTLPDNSVNMLLTDIPYDEKLGFENLPSTSIRKFDRGDANPLNFDLQEFLIQVNRIVTGSFYIFCGYSQIGLIRDAFISFGFTTRLGVWEKTNPSPVNGEKLWLSGVETCVFARKSNAIFNAFCKNTVWKFPRGDSVSHPTKKPLALFEYLVKTSSKENDTILDPCMGSGTSGIVCKLHNRNFIGIEISEKYFSLAKRRINSYNTLNEFFGEEND